MKISDVYSLPMVSDEGCIIDAGCRYKIDFDTSDTNCLQQIELVKKAINNHDDLVNKIEFISNWLCENSRYSEFQEIVDWGKSTDELLSALK